MFCNNVLLVFAALIALTAAIPYFPLLDQAGEFEKEYENNENVWGNAPLKMNPKYMWGEWGHQDPAEQAGASESEQPDVESEAEDIESEAESEGTEVNDQIIPVAGGTGGDSSGEETAQGGAIAAGDTSGTTGTGAEAGTGAAATGEAAPVVVEQTHHDVYAAAGPAPGQLKGKSSSGQGLGIALGVCSLVVATTAIAVFAIRKYWRHRL